MAKKESAPKMEELDDRLSKAKNAVQQFTAMLHYHYQTKRLLEFNLEDAQRAVKELTELETDALKRQTSINYDNPKPQVP